MKILGEILISELQMSADILLTRDNFRESVFARDSYKCVVCGKPAKDAHHIIERRLFSDGGYYLNNGASVCEEHHLACESTAISVEEIRAYAGITRIVLPPHLYPDHIYDKWGNTIMEDGRRTRGELFFDESVQKVLSPVLHVYTDYVKYPRTFHFPWSPGIHDDDRVATDLSVLSNETVVVTVKMDGENTTMYNNYIHARSLDYSPHPSRNRIKALWANISYDIPAGWRICGENLIAKHAIHYENLKDFFQVFSIWTEENETLSWSQTLSWVELLGLTTVPVLYEGPFDETKIKALFDNLVKNGYNGDEAEGIVVRTANGFKYKDFRTHVVKAVRAGHVPLHGGHWKNKQIVENKVISE